MYKLDLQDTDSRIFGKMLREQAEHNGDGLFLITDDMRISFADAEDITNRLATGLAALGVEAGDRVAMMMGSRPEMVLLTLAVNKLAAVWTPINGEYKGQWLADNLSACQCKLLLVDESKQQRIADVADSLSGEILVLVGDRASTSLDVAATYDELLESAPFTPNYEGFDYGDNCAILWTSGTTGKSKGVLQSYNSWIRAIAYGASLQYDSQDGDIIYCMLPLYNSAAWITSIYRSLIEGIPCVIEQKFSVSGFWDRIRHFGATQTFAIGAMGVFLLNAPEKPDDADTPLKKAAVIPLPPNLWPIFEKRFGLTLVRSGLGMSECLMILNQQGVGDDVPVYALGTAPEDAEVCLLDDDGKPVPDGQPGEICIKPLAPHVVFNGYFDNPEATADTFFGEWFRTGDLGRKDPSNGAYFYVDRKKDAVRYAGRNISSMEVESVAGRHPDVEQVAAFGIPSDEMESEQELKVNIVLKDGAQPSHEDICAFINDNGPFFFVPRYMEFVDSLPMTPTGKVQKFKLRDEGIGANTWDLKKSPYKVQR